VITSEPKAFPCWLCGDPIKNEKTSPRQMHTTFHSLELIMVSSERAGPLTGDDHARHLQGRPRWSMDRDRVSAPLGVEPRLEVNLEKASEPGWHSPSQWVLNNEDPRAVGLLFRPFLRLRSAALNTRVPPAGEATLPLLWTNSLRRKTFLLLWISPIILIRIRFRRDFSFFFDGQRILEGGRSAAEETRTAGRVKCLGITVRYKHKLRTERPLLCLWISDVFSTFLRTPNLTWPTTVQRCRSETEKFSLEDLFSSVLSQFKKKVTPLGTWNLIIKANFQSLKLRNLMGKMLRIFHKLNCTPNTLGCYGLTYNIFSNNFTNL